MSEFKPITTQEEFDAAIGDRIKREKETLAKKYEGYISQSDFEEKVKEYQNKLKDLNASISEANQQIEGHKKEIEDRDQKIKGYEINSVKMRISHEIGIPYELVSRLSGEDEESIRKDAEKMLNAIKSTKQEAPLATHEPAGKNSTEAALRSTLKGLKGE